MFNQKVHSAQFVLFIDEPMLRSIQKYTIKHGQADDKNFSVELCELEKSIGLQIARGILTGKNTPIHQLWSKECFAKDGIPSLAKQSIEITRKN